MRPRLLFCVSVMVLCLILPSYAADRAATRAEILKILMDLVQPVQKPTAEGKAWLLAVEGNAMGKAGLITLGWDGKSHVMAEVNIEDLASAQMVFGEKESWLHLPKKNKTFLAEHDPAGDTNLLGDCKAWDTLKTQLPVLTAMVQVLPIPDEITLDKTEDGTLIISDGKKLDVRITRVDGTLVIQSNGKDSAKVIFKSWEQIPEDTFINKLVKPTGSETEKVDVRHLRAMLSTLADVGAEKLLVMVNPDLVPMPLAGVPKEQGIPIVHLKGTPEQMGLQHGSLLKEAAIYNMNRTLHGVGLASTVETGLWFPGELEKAWKQQEKYIPERFVREIDAMADATGMPREWARAVNIFPEFFHCSGLALRGKATVDGKLYHGRILDYMTDIGLQNTAVIMVFEPVDHNAWVSISYAGFCSTVSAMNEKGLSMGEMGGRGNGYLDGIPMSIMMREIMERFETLKESLDYMKKTPRTCEYFYVLTDSTTKDMAGVASWASKLAQEKGHEDLQIIHPGKAHELLPRPFEDVVLMSAGDRYDKLADRVQEGYGSFDMEKAWNLMSRPVAMRSNLHTVLFAPESLDFWAAQAGPRGEPACTQKITKFNLKQILSQARGTQTSDTGSEAAVN